MTLFVVDEQDKMIGAVTDGDTRRALLKGAEIDAPITEVMFKDFRYLKKDQHNVNDILKLKEEGIKLIPLLGGNREILAMVDFEEMESLLPVDAVIMAGGKGLRLRPLTDKTPKPLLRIGEKPILAHTIDRLRRFGIQHIHISINYLGDQIENYFGDGSSDGISIEYIREKVPLGTIGALGNLKNLANGYVLVMNSDLLTTIDYEDFFKAFCDSGADMAIATIPYEVEIPYAILETDQQNVTSLKEKPTYTHFSNAGIYLCRREVIKYIPKDKFYNATDLIEDLISKGRKVVYYQILGYWLDIGKPDDFQKAQRDITHLRL
ncbi:MAG: nucleotidyltransferase family protein [Cyclobacteriaceae bacterium]|nr:nucleotidyltransferase family protein [Cyclobacteriaceae bacterium HetDA_MAG_MS6]